MAKRTRNTIPGNLTLVEESNDADEKAAQPARKAATSKRARKGTTSGKGDATAKDDASDAHEAPVGATNGKARAAKKKAAKGLTMIELRERYLDHLERLGKSPGTRFSYGVDIMMAVGYLGEDTPIAELTVDQIREFYESAAVTRTRSSSPKSQLTIDKTRRVLRQALTWAASEGAITNAPLPMEPTPPRRRKDIAEQVPTESEARS